MKCGIAGQMSAAQAEKKRATNGIDYKQKSKKEKEKAFKRERWATEEDESDEEEFMPSWLIQRFRQVLQLHMYSLISQI